jgi:hypothetical protein
MSASPTNGVLIVSIDVDPHTSTLDLSGQRQKHDFCRRMIELAAKEGIAATWALADPANSPLVRQIVRRNPASEIAVLGDPAWVGYGVGRGHFAGELSRRILAARAEGLAVSTLAVRHASLIEHLDVAVKYGVTAVRNDTCDAARRRDPSSPRPLRYGLWELPATVRLPDAGRLWSGGETWRTRRAIDAAVASGGVCHLVLDGPAWHDAARHNEHVLNAVLQYVAIRRKQGTLVIETLAAAAARMSQPKHRASPARSILRAAVAAA